MGHHGRRYERPPTLAARATTKPAARRLPPAAPGVEKPGAHRGDIVARVGADETDAKYYERVEVLAKRVCSLALDEGWLTYLPEDEDQTPLQQAVNEMARHLRHIHQHDDGCLGH